MADFIPVNTNDEAMAISSCLSETASGNLMGLAMCINSGLSAYGILIVPTEASNIAFAGDTPTSV